MTDELKLSRLPRSPWEGYLHNVKDCPCCGAPARVGNYIVEGAVFCVACRLTVTRTHAPTKDTGVGQAIAAWNRRAP